nr:PREDICTED: mitochondrial inner membrane protease subunit 1 isoform X1 [Nicotiana tabacum]
MKLICAVPAVRVEEDNESVTVLESMEVQSQRRNFTITSCRQIPLLITCHQQLYLLPCHGMYVYGPSMLPTLNLTGDVLLAEHLSPLLDKLGPGDVVLVRSPDNPRKTVTKRIVGMEGDTVTFLADPARSNRHVTLKVPKGHVWIQGDNIYASKDSRQLGPIPYGLILGKVLCRVWPPEGFGSL